LSMYIPSSPSLLMAVKRIISAPDRRAESYARREIG
jgi:hypothetical protein